MKKKLPDLNTQLVAAMRESSNKWDFIKRIIEDEQKAIDWNIHSKTSDDGSPLDAKAVYDLATWYGFLDYIANLPEMILNEAKPKPKQKEPDFETYDTPLSKVRETITGQDAA